MTVSMAFGRCMPLLLKSMCLALLCSVHLQAQSTAPATQPLAKLRIEVVDVRASKGNLIFGIFANSAGFPTDSKKASNWQIKPADSKGVAFECQLPPGKYGASVLHDQNSNGNMDTSMLGIPSEGYGVTNNPKPRFRQAGFDESIFTLPPEGATLKISIQYFN